MPLNTIDYAPGQDTQNDVYDKTNAAIDDLNNNQIKWKVISIGDWNMDANSFVSVAHGLSDYKKIRIVSIVIRDDADSGYYTQEMFDPYTFGFYMGGLGATNIVINRQGSGPFDGSGYDSISYNRGFVTIGYVE